jgi:hypothetical protein
LGRHSSPEQSPYVRSVAGWVLPWVLVAAVAVVAVVVGVSALGQQPIDARPPPESDRRAAAPESSPTEEPSPTPTPTRDRDEDRKDRKDRKDDEDEPPELITEGVTVQVLNATGDTGADGEMTARLTDLGFEIAAVVTASRRYDRTTVFWSAAGDRAAGRALAERFGWKADRKPANLSSSVDVHVVIGADEV